MSFNAAGLSFASKNLVFSDNEPLFLKDLATALFRVVGYFRRHILFDQNDMAPTKLRTKHTLVWQATNCNTQFTNMKELVTLQDDIIELKIEEPNYDMFNKESVMLGVHYIVRRIKKMEH